MASIAKLDTIENYEQNLEEYRNKRFTYVPLPADKKYVNTEENEVYDFEPEQFIYADSTIYTAIEKLQNQPFLFPRMENRIGYDGNELYIQSYGDPREESLGSCIEAAENYPDKKEEIINTIEGQRLYIITLADLNRRKTKEALYPLLAELESVFASKIGEAYPGEQQIEVIPELGSGTIDRWGNARKDGLEMHVAEFMTLSEMLKVVGKTEEIREQFGFSSRNKFDDYTGGLINLRNPVMHSSRTLVHSREDLKKLVERIDRCVELIQESGVNVYLRQYSDQEQDPWYDDII
ncbi:hypothetical protein GOC74_02045 [Halomicrobium mukohataei]|uniref:Uncharacterized protein n=1 Tax=Halomicrobium mukohataei TaxID=57705 RepID=A0A847U6V1_9EURY|nr:hypothetical protein [Halomicrobium mukohataei]NLV08719.1 hypothetical protein [Halomicrobium mukohataei]